MYLYPTGDEPTKPTSETIFPNSSSSTRRTMVPCLNMKSNSISSISAFCLSNSSPKILQGDARSSRPPPKILACFCDTTKLSYSPPFAALDGDGREARGAAKPVEGLCGHRRAEATWAAAAGRSSECERSVFSVES